MFKLKQYENRPLFLLRWMSRVLGFMSTVVLLVFLVGTAGDLMAITWNQAIGLVFFPFGLMIGLMWAWRNEIAGGSIAVGSVLGFYFIYEWLLNGSWPRGWWFAIFTIPGLLFLSYGIIAWARRGEGDRSGSERKFGAGSRNRA